MPTRDPTEGFVRERLKADREEAESRADELKARHQPITDDDIKHFFPELSGLNAWSNLPLPVELPHYLILGLPVVFDLEPFGPDRFREQHRIDVQTATDLAKDRYLLPNLYIRNPSEWRGSEHLKGLLELATVNGERVDTYLRLRDPRFDEMLTTRQNFFKKVFLKRTWPTLGATTQQAILKEARLRESEAIPRVIGTRWAYLDVLAPSVSTKIDQLLEERDYLRAFQIQRGARHLIASPITAALGGKFVCGSEELRLVKIAKKAGVKASSREWNEEIQMLETVLGNRETIEYFIHEITRIPPFRVINQWDMAPLRRVIEDEEMKDFKWQMYEALEKMMQLARTGGNLEPKVADFRKMVREFQRKLNTYQKYVGMGVDLTSFGLGGLISAVIGAVMGGIRGGVAGAILGGVSSLVVVQDVKQALGTSLYQRRQRDQHLVLTTVQRLRDIAQGKQ